MIMKSIMPQRLTWFCLVLTLATTQTAPVNEEVTIDQAMSYLQRYHYIGTGSPDPKMASLQDPGNFQIALKRLQAMGHIPVTGEYDEATQKLMEMPRCGNSDNDNMASVTRKKRFVTEGSKWSKTELTYKFVSYSPDMSRSDQEQEIARAFKVWSDVTPLTFKQVSSGRADIDILFAVRDHGDGSPFDGPGGTLAHAYFPRYGGTAHFDDDESFTLNIASGINLFQVAAHEFGHSLGLSHSSIQSALMAPFYRGYQPNFILDYDDIQGIQSIYGRAPNSQPGPAPTPAPAPSESTRTTSSTTPSASPDYCTDGQFDDIISLESAGTFGFRGPYYYKIGSLKVEQGYPRLIAQDWQGLPNNIDAAISFPGTFLNKYNPVSGRWERVYTNEQIWFFKGSYMYKYDSNKQPLGQRESISKVIRGLPDNLDAAFTWSGNGRTYITKGSDYYRLNEDNTAVDTDYPRPIAVWTSYSSLQHRRQINSGIDAAFEYSNDRTYFFVGPNYYRFNDQAFSVDDDYPRSVALWWYGCSSSGNIKDSGANEMTNITSNFETVTGDADNDSQDNYSQRDSASVLLAALCSLLVLSLKS